MISIQIVVASDTATPLLERILQQLTALRSAHITLGATAAYAGFVEFGTRRMGAQPYLRPAVDASIQGIVDAYVQGLMTGDVLAALEMVGTDMENMARSIVPVDTGFLRSTIYHTVS